MIFCPSFSLCPCSPPSLAFLFVPSLHIPTSFTPGCWRDYTHIDLQTLTIMAVLYVTLLPLLLLCNQSRDHPITFFSDPVFMLRNPPKMFLFCSSFHYLFVFIHLFTLKHTTNHTRTLNMFIHIFSHRWCHSQHSQHHAAWGREQERQRTEREGKRSGVCVCVCRGNWMEESWRV